MFGKDIDILVDSLFPLDWDRKTYTFNRGEKDMHPYDIKTDKEKTLISHNILGINKEDLKIKKEVENGISYLVINGKTIDDITGKEYSINSRFALDDKSLDLSKISATTKNGLLYITIPVIKEKKKETCDIKIS
jgi:HSP20 family molecular chaperone IbpA